MRAACWCHDGRVEQSKTVDIAADPTRVWEVVADVERWSEWSETVTVARRLDDGPLRPGARTQLKQPRLPTGIWTVTELEPGQSFTWVQTGPGLSTVGRHELDPLPGGGTRVRLTIDQRGLLGAVVGRLYAGLTDRYLALEAAGLKAECEGGAVA